MISGVAAAVTVLCSVAALGCWDLLWAGCDVSAGDQSSAGIASGGNGRLSHGLTIVSPGSPALLNGRYQWSSGAQPDIVAERSPMRAADDITRVPTALTVGPLLAQHASSQTFAIMRRKRPGKKPAAPPPPPIHCQVCLGLLDSHSARMMLSLILRSSPSSVSPRAALGRSTPGCSSRGREKEGDSSEC